ncbi:hypothetical protein PPL_06979 [Heterostelium album PN500]|uniref:Peptidase S54 rhomboid domain-containing protein n=1 Tax=Heterostelium pallidum (strain ATCC 26659 / Pp 5 / PN500) TaxID=670386 RepID=D3BE26_HETP5|nr:hypothetical protein PPL_06979 [Heterostelium album PN500]EFA80157.1 hypothetical protein PPL_06979 [Heterostelium album PN500]|eukprot:XP_020432277.1 hypothetical protein PPL_06979 [Heterostelium album PN500]
MSTSNINTSSVQFLDELNFKNFEIYNGNKNLNNNFQNNNRKLLLSTLLSTMNRKKQLKNDYSLFNLIIHLNNFFRNYDLKKHYLLKMDPISLYNEINLIFAGFHVLESLQSLTPGTSIMMMLIISIWLYQFNYDIGPYHLTSSCNRALKGEYRRTLLSIFSHSGLIHLVLNCVSLIDLKSIEETEGSFRYLQYTFMLIITCVVVEIIISKQLSGNGQRLMDVESLGYSGVLFGLLVISTFRYGIMSSARTALYSLIITQIFNRNAHFIGHLAGIVAGAIISASSYFKVFDLYFYSVLILTMILTYQNSSSGNLLEILSSLNPFQSRRRIVNGVIVSRY